MKEKSEGKRCSVNFTSWCSKKPKIQFSSETLLKWNTCISHGNPCLLSSPSLRWMSSQEGTAYSSRPLPCGGIQGDVIVCDTAHGSFPLPAQYASLLCYYKHGIILESLPIQHCGKHPCCFCLNLKALM